MDPFSALISAGGSLLGGLMGQSSNKAAIAAQQSMNAQNIAAQYDFAKNGLSWKEADARAGEKTYGINPLAALGSPTSSFSNVTGSFPSDNPMGQGVERAAQALSGIDQRGSELSNKLKEAQIANVNSDTVKNQALASQAVTASTAAPPAPPVAKVIPPLYTKYRDRDGQVVWLPSKDASSSLQNAAAYPQAARMVITGLGDAIGNEAHVLFKPISDYYHDWVKRTGASPVRGDVWRSAMPVYQPGG